MDTQIVFLSVGVLVAVLCGIYALSQVFSKERRQAQRRVEAVRLRSLGEVAPQVAKQIASVKRVEKTSLPLLDRLAKQLPRQSVLRDRLAKTGYEMAIGTYLLINFFTAVATFLVCWLLADFGVTVAALFGVMGGVGLPHMAVNYLGARRINKFNAIFPDAIDLIVRGLRSGLPVTESMAAVGREMPDPVGQEFRQITDAVRFGLNLESALWDTAKRLDTAEFKFFVISLSVQRETGGNLGETLANLSDILRKRKQMRLKIKAMSSEARASAYILGGLPFLMFGVLFLLNPDYLMVLIQDPRGHMMLGAGLGIMGLGIVVMYKMVKFEI